MRHLALAVIGVFLFSNHAVAQAQSQAPAPQPQLEDKSQYDRAYLKMVENASSMPANFDFAKVRELYPRTSFYSPFGEMGYKEELFDALDKAKLGDQAALEEAHKISFVHFAHFKVHSYMLGAIASKSIPNTTFEFHKWALQNIGRSMIQGKNASSPANAIKVLDVSEEYLLIRTVFRGKAGGHSVLHENGRVYDVMNYTDEAGNKKTAYFDVTTPFASYPVDKKQ